MSKKKQELSSSDTAHASAFVNVSFILDLDFCNGLVTWHMTAKKSTHCAQHFSESKQQNTWIFLCTLIEEGHHFAREITIKTIDFNASDSDVVLFNHTELLHFTMIIPGIK